MHFWQTLPVVSDRARLWAALWKTPVRVLFTEIAEGELVRKKKEA